MRMLFAVWQLPIVVLMTCFVVEAPAKNLPPIVSILTPTNGQMFQATTTQSPTSSLWITKPVEGATFNPPASITIQATAIDPRLYIRRVEFF